MARGSGVSSRDRILNTARSLIDANGYDGMAVSELSTESGLPPSSIYYHFGNKLGVLAALLERTFEELHSYFPQPAAFDDLPPVERLEAWFTAACTALDEQPDYLRLLVSVSVGPQKDIEAVAKTLRRIRDYAHASWTAALTPIFPDDAALVDQLAVLGRALSDGLAVSNSVDGLSHRAQVAPFVALVRGLAESPKR
ncbi:TetR/AcrR family transcriptional regulator [Kribbella sandramycini]|uniref:AcrR family transcriptional regulator n=1 Tax=Kribbella sandramycini TaxID=60450 RepID=A0A7Y4P2C4_9ACTN|nr:TetR/AcrR family transcriptional regulator [Kribbella sandramycini]MBB6570333.1 AcrR family transcriptional regulator [Kribbella sandramycini]NOL45197.1 TetR/AcrR family transcriptional regulator [Kribbella sandramycini]